MTRPRPTFYSLNTNQYTARSLCASIKVTPYSEYTPFFRHTTPLTGIKISWWNAPRFQPILSPCSLHEIFMQSKIQRIERLSHRWYISRIKVSRWYLLIDVTFFYRLSQNNLLYINHRWWFQNGLYPNFFYKCQVKKIEINKQKYILN